MEENNNKKKKIIIPIIIVLLLIIIGLGAFIYFNKDKLFGEKENKPEETEKEEIEEEKNNEEVVVEEQIATEEDELQKYVDYIKPISIGPAHSIYGADKVVASELTARGKIHFIGSHVHEKKKLLPDSSESVIAESDVKEEVERIYGPGTYERTVFNLGCGDYTFHEDDNNFYAPSGCGGTTAVTVRNVIIDYSKTKSKLVITTAYAFNEYNYGIYKNYQKDGNILEEGNFDGEYLENFIKEHKDELNHIVYTFESPDGVNYYFKEFVNQKS